MCSTMSSEERNAATREVSDSDNRSGVAERCAELDVLTVRKQVVETRTSEDPDFGAEVGGS